MSAPKRKRHVRAGKPKQTSLYHYRFYLVFSQVVNATVVTSFLGAIVNVLYADGSNLTLLRSFMENCCPWAIEIGRWVVSIKGITTNEPYMGFFYLATAISIVTLMLSAFAAAYFGRVSGMVKPPQAEMKPSVGYAIIVAVGSFIFVHQVLREFGFRISAWLQVLLFAAVFCAFWLQFIRFCRGTEENLVKSLKSRRNRHRSR